MIKEITFFQPDGDLGIEESERHYSGIHKVMVRRMFRSAPSVVRYTPVRIVGQRDLLKGFNQRPDHWRYVMMQHSEQEYFLGTEMIDRIWLDHRNCLEEMRNYRLEEQVLHDGLAGQTACTKFVLLVPSTLGLEMDADWKRELSDAFSAAFGARVLTFNRVLGSRLTEDRGRVITAEFVVETDIAALLELDFDNEEWGWEFLADPAVEELLKLELAEGTIAYQVSEDPGIDRR